MVPRETSTADLVLAPPRPSQEKVLEKQLRIVYHQRTGGGDAQGIHIQEMIGAFHEIGVVVHPTREPGQGGSRSGSSLRERLKRHLPYIYDVLLLLYNAISFIQLLKVGRKDFDFIYERYSLFSVAGTLYARLKRKPLFLEVNSPLVQEESELGCLRLKRLAAICERHLLKSADYVVVVTRVLGDILVKDVPTLQAKLLVTPNAVRPDCLVSKQEVILHWNSAKPIVFGFVGWFRLWNGLDKLIQEFHWAGLSGQAQLCFVGDGPEMKKLIRLTKELNLQREVEFTGPVPHHQVRQLLQKFHVSVVPDANPYCSPMKLFEYMSAGKPVVAPDQPNLREVITSGRNGYLYQKGEPHSLGKALLWFVEHPEQGEEMGLAAIDSIVNNQRFWVTNARLVAERALLLCKTRN